MSRYRVTVDTGGTFSDFVYLNEDTGEVSISKVPSTPDDPSRAILQGRRDAARPGRAARRHLVLLSRHHRRHQRAARRQGRPDRPAGDRRLPRHLSGRRAGAALRRADLRRHVRQAGAAGAAEPHRRGARARRLPRQRAASRSTRRRCARPCATWRRRRSSRWRCACCSRSCIRSTRRACARSSRRRCRIAASRCRPRSCRRSASTTG